MYYNLTFLGLNKQSEVFIFYVILYRLVYERIANLVLNEMLKLRDESDKLINVSNDLQLVRFISV